MPTTVVITPPIRADVDEAAVPTIFDSVTTEPFDPPTWDDEGKLVVFFPTVDLTDEQQNEVIRLARQEPAVADLSGPVTLPPGIIPEEGVTQFAQAVIDEAVIDHLQGRVAVVGELVVATYDPADPGGTTPAPDSNVLSFSSGTSDLVDIRTPTGEVGADGEAQYDHLLLVPAQARDANGEQIALVLQGNAFLKAAKAQTLELKGSAFDGEISKILPGAQVELGNTIPDPTSKPTVTFDAKHRRWPNLTSNAEEIGWGIHNGMIVQARHNSGSLLQARFVNPDTGLLDHEVDLTNWANVAGFTAGGGYLFVLGKLTSSGDWAITRWTPSGTNTGVFANPNISSAANAALGFDGGQVLLLDVGRKDIRRYGTGLNLQSTVSVSGIGDVTRATGVGQNWLALGNEWAWLAGTGSSRTAERANSQSSTSRGWWSYCSRMTGAGQLPSGQFAASNQTGQLAAYNDDRLASANLYAGYTDVHTPSGRETLMSPYLPVRFPARTYATIVADSPPPGTDDVNIYASGTSGARTSMWLILGKQVGQTQVTISEAPTAGTNPPDASGFTASGSGDPGEIVSQAKDGVGDPLLQVPGNGQLKALIGSAGQIGEVVTGTFAAAPDNKSIPVTFAVPFTSTPVITLTAQDVVAPQQVEYSVESKSATGFTLHARRSENTGSFTVGWKAEPKTQQ